MDDSDKDFMKFLDDDSNTESKSSNLFFLMVTVREKFRALSELYKNSLEAYIELNKGTIDKHSLLKDISDFIRDLIKNSQICIDQMDLIIGEEINAGNDEDPENFIKEEPDGD